MTNGTPLVAIIRDAKTGDLLDSATLGTIRTAEQSPDFAALRRMILAEIDRPETVAVSFTFAPTNRFRMFGFALDSIAVDAAIA